MISRPVPGYETILRVYEDARVENIQKGKFLNVYDLPNGYQNINIYKDKKQKTILLHRVVAMAFIPNPENKPQVNHLDGNKKNNHLNNLEWCTASENHIHSFKHLNRYRTYGVPKSDITKKKISETLKGRPSNNKRKIYAMKEGKEYCFESLTTASSELKVGITAICNNLKGRSYKAGGYEFRYEKPFKK